MLTRPAHANKGHAHFRAWYSGNAMIVTVFVYGVVITVATFVGFVLPGNLS